MKPSILKAHFASLHPTHIHYNHMSLQTNSVQICAVKLSPHQGAFLKTC